MGVCVCTGAVRAADGVMKVGTSAVLQGLKSQAAENLNGVIHGEKGSKTIIRKNRRYLDVWDIYLHVFFVNVFGKSW